MHSDEKKLTLPGTARIALTGGIAAGKSLVAALLQEKGIPVVSLDELGHELFKQTDPQFIRSVEKAVETEILTEGKIDRSKIRDTIFHNAAARAKLENLLHPLIWSNFLQREIEWHKKGKRLVVAEAALILEAEMERQFTEIVIVWAPRPLRKQRLLSRPGMNESVAEAILNSQLSDDESRNRARNRATTLLENSGEKTQLAKNVEVLIDRWKKSGYF